MSTEYDRDDEGYDPFSTEIGHQNILVSGIAGTGKTFVGASMPGRIAYMMIESQAQDNLKQAIVHHQIERGNIKVFPIRNRIDRADPKGKRLLMNAAGLELTASQVLKDHLNRLAVDPQGFDSVVVDSLTALQELDKFWTKKKKTKIHQADWGDIIDNITDVSLYLRDLRLHTMAIVTTTKEQDDGNRYHHRLSLFGKKLPTDLPRYYNVAATIMSKEDESGKTVRKAVFMQDDRFITKSHLALDDVEEPNVKSWFKKMDAFWGEHQIAPMPVKGEITMQKSEFDQRAEEMELRLQDPEIKDLFDKIKAPKAKRLAGLRKYSDDDELKEVLQARIDELASIKEKKDEGAK